MFAIRRTVLAVVKKKFLFASFCLFFPLFIVGIARASEITSSPTVSYVLTGGDQQIFSSLNDLVQDINKNQEARFSDCISKAPPYGCAKYIITSPYPSPYAVKINGENHLYQLARTEYYQSQSASNGPVTSGSKTAGDLGASVNFNCPSPFSARITGSTNDRQMDCVFVEPSSSACDGNPINIGTGYKFEHEVDYSTVDGFLKIERRYISQFAGWVIDEPNQLVEVPVGTTVPMPKYRSNKLTADYSVVSRRKRYGSNLYNLETYTHIDTISLINSSQQRAVYLTINGMRYRYIEVGGVFVGDGTTGAKTTLIEVNPNNFGGAKWKFTNENGDISYFLTDGSLQRIEFARGGSLAYQYNDGRVLSKTDHLNRSLVYSYDTHGRIISISLPDSQLIVYEYGQDEKAIDFSLLKKVRWPNGESIGYVYNESAHISGTSTNKMLTGKLDALDRRIGIYKYSSNMAVSTEGALASFKRIFTNYGSFTSVKDGLNSTRNYYFNKVLPDGTKLLTSTNQPAGSGCAASTKSATYYDNGFKKSEANFNGSKIQFNHDMVRGLETVRVEGIASTDYVDYLPQGKVLSSSAKKITTQWHPQHRKPFKKSEPKLITTFIYNGDADPFNSNQIANCSPSSQPLLCHKVQQATTDVNGAAGLTAVVDSTIAKREEFYTYNGYGQQLTYSRTGVGTPDEIREYYDITTSDWTKGDLKSITNALGHKTEFTRYDPNGNLLAMQDANGVQTLFTYDARGRLTSQSVAGAVTTHTYDLNGNRIGSVLPNGVTINYEYDAAKRLIAVVNALGDKINYEYDVESNLRFERFTNASGANTYTKQHVYDALSRVKNTLNSNSQGSTYLYDANGNLTSEVDAKTKTTSNTFDPLDRLTRTTDALTGKTDYSYDAQGNLTQVKDPKGNATVYNYNAFGDLVSQVSPDTGTTTFTYDAAGNRTSSTDARSVVVNYSYDALNRLTGIQYPAAASENITYNYDATANGNYGVGRLTSIVTGATRLDFEYNPQGLITKKYAQAGNTFVSTQYRYDAAGNLTGVTYPSGREVNYQLDTTGKVNSISTKLNSNASAQNIVSNISYLPFGPAQSYSYGNGLQHTQTYDLDYRLTGIQVGGILNRSYGYDLVNNITSINNGLQTANSQTYSYDALNRLITAAGGYGNLGYSYDAVGNRLTETRNGVSDTYTYQTTSNRLTGITRATGNRSFTYDAAGNPTQRTAADNSNQTFNFNNANRLSSVNVNGALAATYTYNPLGQRVVKTLANGSKEIYHYDEAGQLIAVTDAAGTTVREYIYWGSQQVALVNNGTLYFIHSDHLNTPQVVTNASQQVVWMGDYEPFGKLAQNQSNSIELYSRFPGQYLDGETGLYYNYFRDYDASIGRYIESDPIGLEGGINTYAYVSGNPIQKIDPFGLLERCKTGISTTGGNNWGPAHHSYQCWTNSKGLRVCKGFSFDDSNSIGLRQKVAGVNPGEVLPDEQSNEAGSKPGQTSCTDDDKNSCMDQCAENKWAWQTALPSNYGLLRANTCNDIEESIYESCKVICGAKN